MQRVKKLFKDFFKSIGEIPPILLALYILTIVVMNILANKTIYQNDYIAIDGGIIITWLAILIADIVIKVAGPKIAIKMSIFAIFINLSVCLLFYLVSLIPAGPEFDAFNKALSGTWFIIISGTIAFICSSILNAVINYGVGKFFKKNPNGKLAFVCRSYVSTVISQIFDNFVFNVFAFVIFAPIFWNGFHWTLVQCICCALVYGAIDLVMEIIFTPIGYKIANKWRRIKEDNI